MTIEIIKRGERPGDKIYEAECSHCKTEYRFQKADAKLNFDQRGGDFLSFRCKVCGEQVTKDA